MEDGSARQNGGNGGARGVLVEAMLSLLEAYARRRDLQEAFPEVMSKDYRRLLKWACGVVDKRWEDGAYSFLKPYGRQFETLLSTGELRDPAIDQWSSYFLSRPPVGSVKFGDLRRRTPVSCDFGADRGLPIDRYYMERFLSAHTSDIRGHVLEIGDDTYTQMFGDGRVTKSDVLHVHEGNPKATIVADLTHADHVPSETFDCIIFTQTLQMIYDLRAALRHLHRILKPGGVLLATSHGISKISRREGVDLWGEYWRITTQSARRLFLEHFPANNVEVKAYGNVLAALAFLHGFAAEELRQEELDFFDPDYEVLVTVAAVRLGSART